MKPKGDLTDEDEDKEVTPKPISHRKVWGCGFYAGVKAAGGDPEQFKPGGNMNQAKTNIVISNLSVTERKVLEAVPINHWWNAKQIHSERCRLFNSSAQLKSTSHVLKNLCAAKVVREDNTGKFQRCPCSYKADIPPIKQPVTPIAPVEKEATQEPITVSKVTPQPKSNVQCITTKKELEVPTMTLVENIFENIKRARELMTRIEVDVLALEEQATKNKEDMISLTQLKKLLDGQGK